MSIFDRFKKKKGKGKTVTKYNLLYLGDSTSGKWKVIKEFKADDNKESLDEISAAPPPGLYRYTAEYPDEIVKVLWKENIGGYQGYSGGKRTKKETPVEVMLGKIAEQVDFSTMQLSKLNLPSDNFNLEFVNPSIPQGNMGEGGYMVVDGQQIPVGQMPPIEFEGKLPIWMHPAITATVSSMIDKFSKQIGSAASGAFRNAIGIGKIEPSPADTVNRKGKAEVRQEKYDEGYDKMLGEFDKLEGDEGEHEVVDTEVVAEQESKEEEMKEEDEISEPEDEETEEDEEIIPEKEIISTEEV